mgnify:CR=1 FL=1
MARLKYKYTEQNIVDLYFRKLRFRSSPGVDHVARDRFERIFDSEKDIIVRKVLAGEYHFQRAARVEGARKGTTGNFSANNSG